MKRWTRSKGVATLVALFAVGGLAALGGQQQTPPRIDVDKLATQLGLGGDQKAELNQVNQFLATEYQAQTQWTQARKALSAVFSSLAKGLNAEQLKGLRSALREVRPMGSMGSHMGAGMGMSDGGMGMMGRGMDMMGGCTGTKGSGMMGGGMGQSGSMGSGTGMGADMRGMRRTRPDTTR